MTRKQITRVVIFLFILVVLVIAFQATGQKPVDELTDKERAVRDFTRMGIFISGAIVLGFMVAVFLMPFFGDKIAGFFYNAPEKAEPDPGSHARALVAQGHYDEAMEAYLDLAKDQPENRLPVVEAMRLAREKLHNPVQAILIVREALARHQWPQDDQAFFLFRLAEIHDEDLAQRQDAIALMREVTKKFPGTSHTANALHKLKEWGAA